MLKAKVSGLDLGVVVWTFPCGEVGVKLGNCKTNWLVGEHVRIELEWEGGTDMMALAQVVDVIKSAGADKWSLNIPYFPYARQDRRCSPGEAHALKVFCTFLNSLGFSSVRTYDPHSSVLEALVDKLVWVSQEDCAFNLPQHQYLIAPDAGAEKKIFKHYQVVEGKAQVLCASKVRGPDGRILSTRLHDAKQIMDMTVCVVDDICDGGATFLELGKVLRDASPQELNLYVTHGMFTKGVDKLLEIYDNIYTANLCNKTVDNPRVKLV